MKFQYNHSDRSSNIFTKFDQNPTQSKRDKSRKSGTDRQTHTHTRALRRDHSLSQHK